MQVNSNTALNNVHAMQQAQSQMGDLAQKVADVSNTLGDPQNQEVTQDLVDAITEQIPTQIAYQAAGEAVKVENAVQDTLLNLKA